MIFKIGDIVRTKGVEHVRSQYADKVGVVETVDETPCGAPYYHVRLEPPVAHWPFSAILFAEDELVINGLEIMLDMV